MALMKPLVVYLDSSDFSDLSDPAKTSVQMKEVEKQLIEWQKQGVVELRFSYMHVTEAAATKIQYVDVAAKRFSVIKNLCVYRCFIDPTQLLSQEVLKLTDSYDDSPSLNIFNNSGNWFPPIEGSDELEDIEVVFKDALMQIPDRATRRARQKALLDKSGKLNLRAREELISSSGIINEFASKLPIPRHAIEGAIRGYLKTGSMNQFLDTVRKYMGNLEAVGEWYAKDWDRISPLSASLREIGFGLKESLLKAVIAYQNVFDGSVNNGHAKSSLNLAQGYLHEMMSKLPDDYAGLMAKSLGVDLLKSPSWGSTPSLLTLATVSGQVGKISTLSGRKPKISDFGDIYHSMYLPHVDVFRADGFTASAIKEAKLPFKTLVVDKFIELPEAIESLLEKES